MRSNDQETRLKTLTTGEVVAAYYELTKPRITFLVVLTAAAGYCLGSPHSVAYAGLFHLSVGIALLSSGVGALNQYIDRDLDSLMRRTAGRPLPAEKVTAAGALTFGPGLCGLGA